MSRPNASDLLPLTPPLARRSFFRYAGAAVATTALVVSACESDEEVTNPSLPIGNSTDPNGVISLGAGDIGVLNYAYVLEQLEADFYAKAAATSGLLTGDEQGYFQQIAAHEAIHRDFFRRAITMAASSQVLRRLTPQYPATTFDSRATILATASKLEDLGVAAYNGIGKLIQEADFLVIVAQIGSVEARHAAYIHGLIEPGSFADETLVNPATGLDQALSPTEVLALAQEFFIEKLDGSKVGVR